MTDPRLYPDRPFLAVSAAIIHEGRVLIVRRARSPASGLFTLPGGVVEAGETLFDAVRREIHEELGITIKPVALAGHREVIVRDAAGRAERHFVILAFAALWESGTPAPGEEIAEIRWIDLKDLAALSTTEGLAAIIEAAFLELSRLK